jgi:hypothetical protein
VTDVTGNARFGTVYDAFSFRTRFVDECIGRRIDPKDIYFGTRLIHDAYIACQWMSLMIPSMMMTIATANDNKE